jgi:Ca2+-binding EF-hand superfamily protein
MLTDFKEAFFLFAKDGTVPAAKLSTLFQSLGIFPSVEDVAEMSRQLPPTAAVQLSFDDFLGALQWFAKRAVDEKEEYYFFFSALDKGDTGYALAADVRGFLSNGGVPHDEIDGILEAAVVPGSMLPTVDLEKLVPVVMGM